MFVNLKCIVVSWDILMFHKKIKWRLIERVGPSAWNDLLFELRSVLMAHPSKFYISLKSFFFVCGWAGSASE